MKALEILRKYNRYIDRVPQIDDTFIKEAITELEALQNRTCESCKHLQNIIDENEISCSYHCSFFDKDFCCNRYEPNGNQ